MESNVEQLAVRIVRLEPMRVASVHAFSASPEHEAWEKLTAWAKARGLLNKPGEHRIFGFNNPSPSGGSPNYGYEFWIQVPPALKDEDGAAIKTFDGGLYAVAHFKGRVEDISERWKQLSIWCENSAYKFAAHQWLEEHLSTATAEMIELDLYLPITE